MFSKLRVRRVYFRKHYRKAAGNPDIALPKQKKAVFIDGDFWHGYKYDGFEKRLPLSWRVKIKSNIRRDAKNRSKLRKRGWKVLRIWEHELEKNFDKTIEKIVEFLNPPRKNLSVRARARRKEGARGRNSAAPER